MKDIESIKNPASPAPWMIVHLAFVWGLFFYVILTPTRFFVPVWVLIVGATLYWPYYIMKVCPEKRRILIWFFLAILPLMPVLLRSCWWLIGK